MGLVGGRGPCGQPLGLVEGPMGLVGCYLIKEGVCIVQAGTHVGLMQNDRVYKGVKEDCAGSYMDNHMG